MKRRDAVKGIILFSLGTGIIYSCTDKYEAIRKLKLKNFNPEDKELELLAILSNIIVPLDQIPELADHTPLPFIFTMLDDVYDSKERTIFLGGYQKFDLYIESKEGVKFSKMNREDQVALVSKLNTQDKSVDAEMLSFYNIIKLESIKYLKTSEYYQRKINYYEMAPGRFVGDVLISQLSNTNVI